MKKELIESVRTDIGEFARRIRAFDAGEESAKTYKGFSGGFGSYPQRNGGYMLRLRMAGGRLTKDRLGYVADSVEKYGIDRMKLTTCQTIQFHNLSAQATEILTRGGGGDFPRNVMASPLSGVEQGESFDALPWAEALGEYLLGKVGTIRMPRKLKVAFSTSPSNRTHATFRDMGFVGRADGKVDVYCAGGLGPNPRMGVPVAEGVALEDTPACVDAMIEVFCTFGNYENRAKARTRYLQEVLGEDGLKAEYAKALEKAMAHSPKLTVEVSAITKGGEGELSHPRAIPQKQSGLYAVSYHPLGGNLPPEKPRQLLDVIAGMADAECRIGADGTLYIINLTAAEAEKVLAVTDDGASCPIQCSVSCIGGSICSSGVRDSQGLLAAVLEAVEEAKLPGSALPAIHVSGCPSSCGTQQVGTIGFQGGAKMVDGKAQPAFTMLLKGEQRQGQERFGEVVGVLLQSEIPAFMVELGQTVAASGLDFDSWLAAYEAQFRALADKYAQA